MVADFEDDIYRSLVQDDETETYAVVDKNDIESHSDMGELAKDFSDERVHVLSVVYLGELHTNISVMAHSHILTLVSFMNSGNIWKQ